jgi:hypothetical protein
MVLRYNFGVEMARRTLFKLGITLCGLLAISSINIQQNNKLSEEKILRDQQKTLALQQQQKEADRKFTADQKDACFAIYKEISKWNNTNSWRYDANSNTCYIQYKKASKKTEAQCNEDYKGDDEKVLPLFVRDWILCKVGLFEKPF